VVAATGVAIWQNFIRDEDSGADVALAESGEQAVSEDSGSTDEGTSAAVDAGESGDEAQAPSVAGDRFAERASRGFPAESNAVIERDVQALLVDFHAAIVGRRFDAAWERLTERKRQKFMREEGRAAWTEAQASLSPYLEPDGLQASVDKLEDDGVARVQVSGMGWTQPGSSCSEWSGITWVKYENGSWRYDPGYATTAERERAWEDRYDALLGAGC